ncbi:MAG: 16S rRNA (adenine(1518)-N(6)/adenine(1519)-N(6))-dimethyltransferase RsmA [Eggerthellaceae bacterium]|nr:16S rRNA (adenine(1518)-N(6)/adenine(1519)-N(6))-dimethyltransferase RsmA [Eggerthellaceae bacterium]
MDVEQLDLSRPTTVTKVLQSYGLGTKYSLGQNFLVNGNVIKRIMSLARVCSSDIVLEVGPGLGTLSVALLDSARALIAVERDPDLTQVLTDMTSGFRERFCLVTKDALDVDEADLLDAAFRLSAKCDNTSELHADGSPDDFLPGKLVSNLPYAVAATIVLKYAQDFSFIRTFTVMVQKEVAQRMSASPGSKIYGAYSVKLQLFLRPKESFDVSPGNFYPPPRVMSTVIHLERYQLTDGAGDVVGDEVKKAASLMADACFANRRKTVLNSCRSYFKQNPEALDKMMSEEGFSNAADCLEHIFKEAGIDASCRGEQLGIEDYVSLGKAMLCRK